MGTNSKYITQDMINWAMENQCVITEGECGFGRPCVGILRSGSWVSWRLHQMESPYHIIGTAWSGDVPTDAYHKADLVVVLEQDDSAWEQLAGWLQEIIDEGWTVGVEGNGATGLQVLISGIESPLLVAPEVVPG